jgi:phage terminase small subunit
MSTQKITQAEMRWRAFAEAYTANGWMANAAARTAGYPEDDIKAGVAQSLLKRPEVMRYIRSFTKRVEKKYEISRDMIFEGLEDALARAIENDDTANRIKALTEMAKLAGFMVEKLDINAKMSWADLLDQEAKRSKDEEFLK